MASHPRKPAPSAGHEKSPDLPPQRPGLTPAQLAALSLLEAGQRDAEVARAVGVARETVARWRSANAPFRAELFARLSDRRSAINARLDGLADQIIDCLTAAVANGDATTALALLRRMDGQRWPAGPITVAEACREIATREAESRRMAAMAEALAPDPVAARLERLLRAAWLPGEPDPLPACLVEARAAVDAAQAATDELPDEPTPR